MKKVIVAVILCVSVAMCSAIPVISYDNNVFLKRESAGKKIALTFDDGPHPIYTQRILNILKEYNIKATFFVIGQNVENYPSAARALIDSECEIGNHTYSHGNVKKMDISAISDELERTERAVKELTDRELTLFRPPEGNCGADLMKVSSDKGYDVILWSVDTKDWAHTPSEQIAHMVLERVSEGDIILMHDYTSGRNTTCDALRLFIPQLIARGYEFVTVSELIYDE